MKTKQPAGLSSQPAKKVDLHQLLDIAVFQRQPDFFRFFRTFAEKQRKCPLASWTQS